MDFISRHSYLGPMQAAILDWAGTTLDYGSCAPAAAFLELFQSHGLPITNQQARNPMGLTKKDHLRAILQDEQVSQQWQQKFGRAWGKADVDRLYQDFVPLQTACLQEHAELIPGLLDCIQELRQRGLKIGSTTGYTRPMMDVLLPEAQRQGYHPDACVCPDEAPAGRPYPWMCYLNAIQLRTYPMCAVVKVGDTLPDIDEGLNAGMWTVGVALTGNLMGLSEAQVRALPAEKLAKRRQQIREQLYNGGAHFVIDGIWELPGTLDEIESLLKQGQKP